MIAFAAMRVSSVCTSSSRAASRAVVASLTASALDHSRAVVDDKDAHDAVSDHSFCDNLQPPSRRHISVLRTRAQPSSPSSPSL
jgi:hypothetical protein